MPRSKLSKVLSSGKLSPVGILGDLRIITDETLTAISRVIDSDVDDIFMLIYNFVDKSLDLFYNPKPDTALPQGARSLGKSLAWISCATTEKNVERDLKKKSSNDD